MLRFLIGCDRAATVVPEPLRRTNVRDCIRARVPIVLFLFRFTALTFTEDGLDGGGQDDVDGGAAETAQSSREPRSIRPGRGPDPRGPLDHRRVFFPCYVGIALQSPLIARRQPTYPCLQAVRTVVFAVLALIPPALMGSFVWQGRRIPPVEHVPGSARPAGQNADAALRAFFATPLAGVKVKEKVVLYDEKGLFDYIDGAAPLYVDRHFRKLAAAEMATPGGSDLTCDVYDMAAPANAQAIFAAEKSPHAKVVDGWPEAISGPMSFVFHQARYYVKLTAFDAKAEAALPLVARALKEKMR